MRAHCRWITAPVFLGALALAFQAIPPIHPVLTTEEGQAVVFDRFTWQYRELTKRLPLSEAWPSGGGVRAALQKYGLVERAPADFIPVPARIAPDVYLVGQDRVSNLTYMLDCGTEGVAIVDPTYETEFDRTVANVEKCGRNRKDIRWVINTHCHVDHAMADRQFRDLGAKIAIHEADAAAVEKGTRVTAYFLSDAKTGGPHFPNCPVDYRLADGETLHLGNKVLEVIHTPGHTPGSACFLLRNGGKNILFSGDTVLYDGRLGWQDNPYANNHDYLASLEKLNRFGIGEERIEFDVLLPGHGAISMDKAYLDVQKDLNLVALLMREGREIPAVPFRLSEYRQQMYGRPAVAAP